MKVRQYRPAFFEGFEDWEGEVNSTKELLELEFVKRFLHGAFHRFSLHRNYWTRDSEAVHLLLAEYEGGKKWWVVAQLDGYDLAAFSDLPDWKPKERMSR